MAQREGFEPSVPLRGTHDFQSCSLGRSDISARLYNCMQRKILTNAALQLFIILYYLKFVNLSGKDFMDKVVKTPITIPAATLNAQTNGNCTYKDGACVTSTAIQVLAILLQTAPATLIETSLTFGKNALYKPAITKKEQRLPAKLNGKTNH